MSENYYVYMVRCQDNSIYTGIAKDVYRRFDEHFYKTDRCAKYTKSHGAKSLECVFWAFNRSCACALENHIKKLSKKQKESIIKTPELLQNCLKDKLKFLYFLPLSKKNDFAFENICDQSFDRERALYNTQYARIKNCCFEGPADGESALKESKSIVVEQSIFSLRYPLWHSVDFRLSGCKLNEGTRAPIWYAKKGFVKDTGIFGVKCLRECDCFLFENVTAVSPEFGWRCRDIEFKDCTITSEYFLFESRNIKIDKMKMQGKYSFQYVKNAIIENSELDTKDAFWHSENVTVKNCTVKGEYLGWYSENLTLIDCKIIGTQPLCYCKGLKLVNCTMENTDLSFEYSEVDADIKGEILSVKNPHSGSITADKICEIITEQSVMENNCKIIIR